MGMLMNGLTQTFTTSKFSGNNPLTDQSLIYALPRTGLCITLELKKITITKGLYAEYAQKYLGLTNVPMDNSEIWQISEVKIVPFNEPDPDQFYSLSFKTYPENLQMLFSIENNGVIFKYSDQWKQNFIATGTDKETPIQDPFFIDETIKEKVDTLYKTVLNDSVLVRIPVFKKQIITKTFEDLAKETAQELIKTRKRRLKMVRGEYDYHPDAQTMKLMIGEMKKQEEYYLALFQGEKKEMIYSMTYTVYPTKELSSHELGTFSKERGMTKLRIPGAQSLNLQFLKENSQSIPNLIPDKQVQNMLYLRVPAIINVTLFIDQDEKAQVRVPFYQFGSIQGMVMKK
jgi:hypothetical protein